MYVVIAADGTVDPAAATRFAAALAGDGGRITVLAVVEVDRSLLRGLRTLAEQRRPTPVAGEVEYAGVRPQDAGPDHGWAGDEDLVGRYLEQQGDLLAGPLTAALAAAGLRPEVVVRESADLDEGIAAAAADLEPDLLVIGSPGLQASPRWPCPVLVLGRED